MFRIIYCRIIAVMLESIRTRCKLFCSVKQPMPYMIRTLSLFASVHRHLLCSIQLVEYDWYLTINHYYDWFKVCATRRAP